MTSSGCCNRQETGGGDPGASSRRRAPSPQAQGWKEQVAPGGTPRWLGLAEAEDGVAEMPGTAGNHPRILGYLATMPGLPPVDETPWCACFVAWCLLRAGVAVPTRAPARQPRRRPAGPTIRHRSFADQAAPGAIAVLFNRHQPAATTASGFHVGFLVERPPRAWCCAAATRGMR